MINSLFSVIWCDWPTAPLSQQGSGKLKIAFRFSDLRHFLGLDRNALRRKKNAFFGGAGKWPSNPLILNGQFQEGLESIPR